MDDPIWISARENQASLSTLFIYIAAHAFSGNSNTNLSFHYIYRSLKQASVKERYLVAKPPGMVLGEGAALHVSHADIYDNLSILSFVCDESDSMASEQCEV